MIHKIFGVSFPEKLLEDLDRMRGDVPRSRYLHRLVEREKEKEKEKEKNKQKA